MPKYGAAKLYCTIKSQHNLQSMMHACFLLTFDRYKNYKNADPTHIFSVPLNAACNLIKLIAKY